MQTPRSRAGMCSEALEPTHVFRRHDEKARGVARDLLLLML